MKKFFSLIAAVLFAGSMMAETYTKTAFADLKSGDVVIITMQKATDVYAASNDKGTSNPPAAVAVTVAENAITTDATNILWTVAKDGANITFKAGDDALYCTNTNNGVRVGSNANNVFSIDAESGYLFNNATSRYIGVYNGADWRCYTTVNNNIKDQTLAFYAASGAPAGPVVDYYVAGSMNGWASAAGNKDYKLAANPGAEGEYMIEMAFAANDAFKVIGYDGTTTTWYPDGMDNNYIITEAGKYTVYFRPAGGQEGWHYGCINAIKIQAITCAEVYALAKNDKVNLLNDVTVTYANGKNVWVKDATASMLIYLSDNTTWKAGDVLSGVAGIVDIYNGVTEIKPSAAQAAAVTATAGEAPAAEVLETVATTDVNKYIVMKNVEFEADAAFADGTQSNITINGVAVRNQFKNGYAFTAGKKYDVYGVVTIYQSNPQVYFITAEESKTTAIDNAAIETKAIKRIENGKLVIIKNGVRFDAQGARL